MICTACNTSRAEFLILGLKREHWCWLCLILVNEQQAVEGLVQQQMAQRRRK